MAVPVKAPRDPSDASRKRASLRRQLEKIDTELSWLYSIVAPIDPALHARAVAITHEKRDALRKEWTKLTNAAW